MKPTSKTETHRMTRFTSASNESLAGVASDTRPDTACVGDTRPNCVGDTRPKIEVEVTPRPEIKPSPAELFQEIDARIKPLLLKDDLRRGFSCKVCGKHG